MSEEGCDNFSIVKQVQVNNCRLNAENEGIIYHKLYPNVTSGEFRLEADLAERGILTIEIFDVNGRRLEIRTREDMLHFNELFRIEGEGIFFVYLRTGQINGSKILKVMVVRP
ncbi:MAG: T9SS type A sorting domain-containing protein [Bacteroidota bacterium]